MRHLRDDKCILDMIILSVIEIIAYFVNIINVNIFFKCEIKLDTIKMKITCTRQQLRILYQKFNP